MNTLMKRLFLFVLCLIGGLAARAATPSFTNPILPYDYSDPDVCRIGDTYLMTSSSFNNVPGLQILASKDLVHWDIVDAAIRYQLPGYQQGDKVLGNFVWAPAIREHDGRVYIYYGDPDRGIYCIRSKEFEELKFPLEWEEPVLVMAAKGYIDPCPLWDEDGRVWLSHGVAGSRFGLKSVLMMAELTADGLSVKTPSRIIFDGHEEHPTSEGTKLYKRNGYYYLMHPAGGVSTGWQVVQRSRSIYGPYELKITLAQGKTDVNGPHQGAWVETPEGENWFFHFQDVGVAGRIVHLQPVRWVDDWPVMGKDGEPVKEYKGTNGATSSPQRNKEQRAKSKEQGAKSNNGPLSADAALPVPSGRRSAPTLGEELPTWGNFARRDEFDGLELGLDWQWAGGRVEPQWFFCDAANSRLRLYSAPREEDDFIPNLLLQKIPYTAFTATARVRFLPHTSPKMEGAEQAGMIVFGRKASFKLEVPVTGEWCYLRLEMDEKQRGQYYIGVKSKEQRTRNKEQAPKGLTKKDDTPPPYGSPSPTLGEELNGNSNIGEELNGNSNIGEELSIEWTKAGEVFQAVEGHWIGAQVGLYCTRDGRKFNDSGWLDVDWFEIKIKEAL